MGDRLSQVDRPPVFFADPDATLYRGDALDVLRELPDESVHAAVTSPPFYGLRNYGVDGQIGLEETPAEWCASLVAVFRELRRVLRSDGVFWLEIGDSYASGSGEGSPVLVRDPAKDARGRSGTFRSDERSLKRSAHYGKHPYKVKDLLLQPFMLAQALRDDGWYLRGCYPWVRPNGMPESAKDRFTVCTSYVFQLTKAARYFFDGDAVAEPATHAGKIVTLGEKSLSKGQASGANVPRSGNALRDEVTVGANRWPRGVFTNPTEPSGLAICEPCGAYWDHGSPVEHCGQPVVQHYAAFPRALVRRCLLASTSEYGVCAACGAPRTRETELTDEYRAVLERKDAWTSEDGKPDDLTKRQPKGHPAQVPTKLRTIGWQPSCSCDTDTVPATILDPFAGSGTSLLVARELGLRSVGIELREAYARMIERRLSQLSLLATAKEA
jgi:DNA modification methylase